MYYPYLRGKMNELLALKELISKNLIDVQNVFPPNNRADKGYSFVS